MTHQTGSSAHKLLSPWTYPVVVDGVALGAPCATSGPGLRHHPTRRAGKRATVTLNIGRSLLPQFYTRLFAQINTSRYPLSEISSSLLPRTDATRKITHYSEICQGLVIARRRNHPGPPF
jgi:hypothetical protein